MPSNEHAALSLRWCFHLVDAMWRHGLREAFLSPGSRCTPLVHALVNHQGIRCHSVLDERSATFMALGAGKGSGSRSTPALFVCTSGTAVANALPAVVEARMSGTPLIVLSADRPPVQRATGAAQTIDQVKLFGDYPVFFFDTGEPVDRDSDFGRIARLGWQAVHYSIRRGGPVHLNLPFRKPLEPDAETISLFREQYRQKSRKGIQPTTLPDAPRPLPGTMRDLLAGSNRILAVIGPELREAGSFFEFCRRSSIPVLNESGGSGTEDVFLNRHAQVLHNEQMRDDLAPDLVLRAGGDPVHRATLEALSSWNAPQVVFGDHPDHPDASLSATHHVDDSLARYDFMAEIRDGNEKKPDLRSAGKVDSQAAYAELWNKVHGRTVLRQSERLQAESRLTDLHPYASLLPLIACEPDTLIAVSNSFPIRDYLQFGPEEVIQKLPLLVNRGASGIDGVTSTAIGAALARNKPVVLFTGDLAFLHDTGALNNLMFRKVTLKIIVLNNRGGTIFRMLPLDTGDPAFIDYFETPQQVDLRDIARAHGIPYALAESPSTLETAWKTLRAHRTAILECRTDTDASIKLRSSI